MAYRQQPRDFSEDRIQELLASVGVKTPGTASQGKVTGDKTPGNRLRCLIPERHSHQVVVEEVIAGHDVPVPEEVSLRKRADEIDPHVFAGTLIQPKLLFSSDRV